MQLRNSCKGLIDAIDIERLAIGSVPDVKVKMASQRQGTLHRYLHSSPEPYTSRAISISESTSYTSMSTSDLEIGSNETSGEVETCSDETGEEEEIGSDETSEEVEPVPKRSKLRKSIAAHHRKTGISQTWIKEFTKGAC